MAWLVLAEAVVEGWEGKKGAREKIKQPQRRQSLRQSASLARHPQKLDDRAPLFVRKTTRQPHHDTFHPSTDRDTSSMDIQVLRGAVFFAGVLARSKCIVIPPLTHSPPLHHRARTRPPTPHNTQP
jgi:hypothetical protein